MKRISMPWLSDFYLIPIPPKLERNAFIAKYFPQYTREYRPPMGIRPYTKNGQYRVPKTTKGSIQSQITKRENRINEAYAIYCAQWDSQAQMDAKSALTV